MSGNYSSVLSLKHGGVRNTHTLQWSYFSLSMHVILVSNRKFLPDLLIVFLGRLSGCSSPWHSKGSDCDCFDLGAQDSCLLCKPIWWLGGWHILSRLETLLGMTDRASWGRGRRACPTVLWKTRHRGRAAGRLRRQPSKRQPVQNNNNTVRWNQTELHKQTWVSNKELRAGRLNIWR